MIWYNSLRNKTIILIATKMNDNNIKHIYKIILFQYCTFFTLLIHIGSTMLWLIILLKKKIYKPIHSDRNVDNNNNFINYYFLVSICSLLNNTFKKSTFLYYHNTDSRISKSNIFIINWFENIHSLILFYSK